MHYPLEAANFMHRNDGALRLLRLPPFWLSLYYSSSFLSFVLKKSDTFVPLMFTVSHFIVTLHTAIHDTPLAHLQKNSIYI